MHNTLINNCAIMVSGQFLRYLVRVIVLQHNTKKFFNGIIESLTTSSQKSATLNKNLIALKNFFCRKKSFSFNCKFKTNVIRHLSYFEHNL